MGHNSVATVKKNSKSKKKPCLIFYPKSNNCISLIDFSGFEVQMHRIKKKKPGTIIHCRDNFMQSQVYVTEILAF